VDAKETCVDCHKAAKKVGPSSRNLRKRTRSSAAACTKGRCPTLFDCFTCHNSHVFEEHSGSERNPEMIAAATASASTAITRSTVSRRTRITRSPSSTRRMRGCRTITCNWKFVRCVECHTPRENRTDMTSHEIVRAMPSRELRRMPQQGFAAAEPPVQFRAKEERETSGFNFPHAEQRGLRHRDDA